jgi:hypothetical protein
MVSTPSFSSEGPCDWSIVVGMAAPAYEILVGCSI